MGFVYEERFSESPYIESVTQGYTVGEGSTVRPAETNWHMVLVKYCGNVQFLVVGPLTSSGVVPYTEGAEILWIKFKLGSFMPHLPTKKFLNVETPLPDAAKKDFWLHGSTWHYPDYENVETFADQLARQDILSRDPLVDTVLQGQPHELADRTVRHRFLRATGLTQNSIFQYQRAQKAAALLQQGVSILDTVYEAGYFDQPHLTRSLKQWIGHTPAEILKNSKKQSHHRDVL